MAKLVWEEEYEAEWCREVNSTIMMNKKPFSFNEEEFLEAKRCLPKGALVKCIECGALAAREVGFEEISVGKHEVVFRVNLTCSECSYAFSFSDGSIERLRTSLGFGMVPSPPKPKLNIMDYYGRREELRCLPEGTRVRCSKCFKTEACEREIKKLSDPNYRNGVAYSVVFECSWCHNVFDYVDESPAAIREVFGVKVKDDHVNKVGRVLPLNAKVECPQCHQQESQEIGTITDSLNNICVDMKCSNCGYAFYHKSATVKDLREYFGFEELEEDAQPFTEARLFTINFRTLCVMCGVRAGKEVSTEVSKHLYTSTFRCERCGYSFSAEGSSLDAIANKLKGRIVMNSKEEKVEEKVNE